VSTFVPGICYGRRHGTRHGTRGSVPARRAITSVYDASGSSVMASTNRATNGSDIARRRCPGPGAQRRVGHQRSDHTLAQVRFQHPEPYLVGQPPVGLDPSVAADHRRGGD
jgi:hypothetical protein